MKTQLKNIACLLGIHSRAQHPNISSFWQCIRCGWAGRK